LPTPKAGCIAVALHARDEQHLKELGDRLRRAGFRCHDVVEADDNPRYANQLMAVGVHPIAAELRSEIRKVTSDLPLVR
jgi:hypothetical protein